MPKRLQYHLDRTVKGRKKSIFIDDPTQLAPNLDEDVKETSAEKCPNNIKRFIPNKNNEIERLLMNNAVELLKAVDHSDFPAFNVGMWPQESSEMLTTYPAFNFSMPRPIFVADKQCGKIDICYKRPLNRYNFIKNMRTIRTKYHLALKSNKNVRSSIKNGTYHTLAFDMAARVHMQPDPFFHSSYDYYFTGGNLCVLPHDGNVIHTGGEDLNEMFVSEFPVVNEYSCTDTLRTLASYKTDENSEIFEIGPLIASNSSDRRNCFIARQRNICTFNYLTENNKMKAITQFRTRSTPFVSFAQSERETSNFIITTMKQHIRCYDLGSGLPKLVSLFEISPPNEPSISWNSVKSWRENTFLYANEKQFFMIDMRTSPEQWLQQVCLFNNGLKCDHISAIQPSDFNNLFYIGTNHKLHCMDVRYIKKYSLTNSEAAVCRWTHQLRYAPLMMDTFRSRQTEYIALSSPIAGDLHICQLSRERNEDTVSAEPSSRPHKHIYSSSCLAYQPPSLLETYEHARLSGNCLNPQSNMQARLKCCTTGMKFFSATPNNTYCSLGLLLTSNSNGDVFEYTLSKRENKETEERCNRHTDEIMKEFEQKICKHRPLNYTEIKNMKGLRKVFLCKSLSSVKKYDLDDMDNEDDENAAQAHNAMEPEERKIRYKSHLGRWQKSLSNLHSYKDALVSDLLSIWDIDMEEEKTIRLGHLRKTVKSDPTVKVESWLQKNVHHNPPMTAIPAANISGYTENDTSNIFDCTIDISQNLNTLDFENAVHSTQIPDNTLTNSEALGVETQTSNNVTGGAKDSKKNKKKNKMYVKGF